MARKPKNYDEIFAFALGFARAQINEGIRPEAAAAFGITQAVLLAFGIQLPRKISGFRTLSQQANLRNVIGADGQPLQPARRSWHTVGLAFDLEGTSSGLGAFGSIWRRLGGRVGADFKSPDPGHFDLPLPGIVPQAAF